LYALTNLTLPFSNTMKGFIQDLEQRYYPLNSWENEVSSFDSPSVRLLYNEYLKESKELMTLVKTKYTQDT